MLGTFTLTSCWAVALGNSAESTDVIGFVFDFSIYYFIRHTSYATVAVGQVGVADVDIVSPAFTQPRQRPCSLFRSNVGVGCVVDGLWTHVFTTTIVALVNGRCDSFLFRICIAVFNDVTAVRINVYVEAFGTFF